MMIIEQPPSRIYLLRHAQAALATSGQRDFDRELTDTGYGSAEIVCEKAVDSGYRPDEIICSTAIRCRQTAEAMQRAMAGEIDIELVDEIYSGTLETYIALLSGRGKSGSVMLVGHNPTIEELLENLAGREQMRAILPDGYPTAGLAVLENAGPDNNWIIRDFIRPR